MTSTTERVAEALAVLAAAPMPASQVREVACAGLLETGQPCGRRLFDIVNEIRYGQVTVRHRCKRCGKMNAIIVEAKPTL